MVPGNAEVIILIVVIVLVLGGFNACASIADYRRAKRDHEDYMRLFDDDQS